MCSPQEHGRRLAELKKDRSLLDNFLHSIGRQEKQTQIRRKFLRESIKHVQDFNGKTTVTQQTIELKQEEIQLTGGRARDSMGGQ